MMEADKYQLRKYREVLVDNITPSDILDHLIQDGIFLPKVTEEISKYSSKNQVRKILDMLEKKGPNAYDAFIKSLQQKKCYDHLVKLLKSTPTDEPDVATPMSACGMGNASAGDSDQAQNGHPAKQDALITTVNITGNGHIIPIGGNVTIHNYQGK